MPRSLSAIEAVSLIKSNQSVFVHGGAATPSRLLEALAERAREQHSEPQPDLGKKLLDVEIMHLHTMGAAFLADEKIRESFRFTNFFVGENMRRYLDGNRVDYLPCFLSEIPRLFLSGRKKIDVALISVSPPDAHGFCSLGTSVDIARAAVDCASVVIAQINRRMPRSHGDGFISLSNIDHWIEIDEPLPEAVPSSIGPDEKKIGELVASLIENGSTLQAGIGAIPDAALAALKDHRYLGLHTEMFSDHALDLIQSGAIDNSMKRVHPGVNVASFCTGTKRVYDALSDNPAFAMLPADYVNDVAVIARNPKVVSINSAVEIDLTGQICADSVGSRILSGVGGQMDFVRGASLSEGGKPIIAIKSQTKSGKSKIVPTLTLGSGVVTTRAHIHHIVTEYGIADLYGKTLGERARALIQIAHPIHRDELTQAWRTLLR